ncbi:MAG: hypothetical protein RW306_03220 [Geobacteraceae bacterium]|nr:hypothetical protein [Geobacteraceae bacterium]
MEYVIVRFNQSRTVLIDGCVSGLTNETLMINDGLHTFTLEGPTDFTPTEQILDITNTSSIKPQEVHFA